MFSSISKSFRSIARGPRAILAEKIAEVLSEHFVLDPEDIESNLLQDARIVLKNTELRQKQYIREELPNTIISVAGVVEEVTFSWRWSFAGGDNSTTSTSTRSSTSSSSSPSSVNGYASSGGMVQDVVLTIKGLEVRIGLRGASCDDHEHEHEQAMLLAEAEGLKNSTLINMMNDTGGAADNQGFMQEYIQQIVDHLTLKIEDFRFVIQAGDGGPSVNICGDGIELGTLASHKSSLKVMKDNKKGTAAPSGAVLSQKLSINSFYVNVVSNGTPAFASSTYPLIEPFGYVASVTRLSGMRFQGGILSGLEIVGLPELVPSSKAKGEKSQLNHDSIILHVGCEQMQALCAVGMLLAPSSTTSAQSESIAMGGNEVKTEETRLPTTTKYSEERPHVKENTSTVFNLPFPALTFILPPIESSTGEQTIITLPKATVVYRADGGIFHIKGQEGIKDSGETLIDPGEGGEWTIDIVQKMIHLGKRHSANMNIDDEKLVTRINIRQAAVERILSSIAPLLAHNDIVNLQDDWEKKKAVKVQDAAVSDPWSFLLDRTILRLESMSDNNDTPTWIEGSIANLHTTLSPGLNDDDGYMMPTELQVEGLELRSSLEDGSFFVVPSFSLKEGILLVPETVIGSIQSTDEAQKLKEMALSFVETFKILSSHDGGAGVDPSSSDKVQTLPSSFTTQIQNVIFSLKSRGLTVECKNISSEENLFSCENIVCTEGLMKVQCQNSRMLLQAPFVTSAAMSAEKNDTNSSQVPAEAAAAISIDITLGCLTLHLYNDLDHSAKIGSVKSKSIELRVDAIQSLLKAELKSNNKFRLEGANEDWIEGLIRSTKASVNVADPLCPFSVESNGFNISSSSFGHFTIDVPSVTILPKESVLTIGSSGTDSVVNVCFGSTVLMKQFQNFITSFGRGKMPDNTSEGVESFPMPFQILQLSLFVADPSVKVMMESMVAESDVIKISCLRCNALDDAHCVIREVSATLGTAVEVSCNVEEAKVPDIAQVAGPIENVKISLEDNLGICKVELGTVKILMLRSMFSSASSTHEHGANNLDYFDFLEVPLHLNVAMLQLCSVPEEDIKVQLAGVKLSLSSIEGLVNIETYDKVEMRLTHTNEWVQSSLQPSFLAIPNTLVAPEAMTCGGFSIHSSSLGQMSISLPQFTLLPESAWLTVDSPLHVNLESLEVAQKIQTFVSNAFKISSEDRQSETSSTQMPSIRSEQINFSVQDPPINMFAKSISVEKSAAKCASLGYHDASGNAFSVEGIEAYIETNPRAKIDTISSLSLPRVMKLKRPIRNISMKYAEGGMWVRINSAYCILDKVSSEETKRPDGDTSDFSIPIPIHIDMEALSLDAGRNCVALFQTIHLSINQAGSSLLFKSRQDMKMRLKRSENEWIDAKFGTMSVIFDQSLGNIKPSKAEFSGGMIGPCSPTMGRLSITIPPLQKKAGDATVSFGDGMTVEVSSLELLDKARPLVDAISDFFCIEPQSEPSSLNQVPFPVQIPFIAILVSKPASKVHMANISALDSIIGIVQVNFSVDGSCSSSMKDIIIDLAAQNMIIGCVESLVVPGSIALSKKVVNLSLRYKGGALCMNIPSPVHTEILTNSSSIPQATSSNHQSNIDIPFPIEMEIAQVSMKQFSDGKETCLRLQRLVLNLAPIDLPGQDLINDLLSDDMKKKGALIHLKVADIGHQLFQVRNIKASSVVPLEDFESFNQLHLAVDFVQVQAGFSSVDWSSLLLSKDEANTPTKTLNTPFAKVDSFKLSISYEGQILASHAKIDVPPFVGDSFTTSQDLTSYYSNIVIQRVPGFLTNAEFLGGNIVDNTFSNAGRLVAGTKSLRGAGIGSVVGVAVSDGIKGAIVAGKKARNAGADEGYKFGDITRGIVRGTSDATRRGARSRGSDGYDYVPGDFTVGAVKGMGEYAGNNKQKLASAGGAGVASVIGMAVAGPIGFMAGSYLGSKVGESAVKGNTSNDSRKVIQNKDSMKQSSQYEQHTVHSQMRSTYMDKIPDQAHRTVTNQFGTSNVEGINNGSSLDQYDPFNGPQHNYPVDKSTHNPTHTTQSTVHHINSHHRQSPAGKQSRAINVHQQSFQPNSQASQYQTSQSYISQSSYPTPPLTKPLQGYNASHGMPLGSNHHHQTLSSQRQFESTAANARQQYFHTNQTNQPHPSHAHNSQMYQARNNSQHQNQAQKGYQFGDFTKNIINKGKESDGRGKQDGYKFGDFTRGLFK